MPDRMTFEKILLGSAPCTPHTPHALWTGLPVTQQSCKCPAHVICSSRAGFEDCCTCRKVVIYERERTLVLANGDEAAGTIPFGVLGILGHTQRRMRSCPQMKFNYTYVRS
jgi:hypothetical protein